MDEGAKLYLAFFGGDDTALEGIVRNYRDGLIFYINSLVGDPFTAEDLAEDTLFKIIVKKPKYNGKASFKTWLYTIGRNTALDYLRKNSKVVTENIEDYQDVLAAKTDLEEAVIKNEENRRLHEALGRIKKEYAEVLHLHYFDDFSAEEIAGIQGKKKNAVEVMLVRAREALKKGMKE